MKVTVVVRPKDGILDPQGAAIDRSLQGMGYASRGVRAGKVFDLDLDAPDAAAAAAAAHEVAERVLTNPLIESFEVVVHGA
jgi:phosphoribosylformylglycinamidine synthase